MEIVLGHRVFSHYENWLSSLSFLSSSFFVLGTLNASLLNKASCWKKFHDLEVLTGNQYHQSTLCSAAGNSHYSLACICGGSHAAKPTPMRHIYIADQIISCRHPVNPCFLLNLTGSSASTA